MRWRHDWPQDVLQAWDRESRTAWWCAERPDRLEIAVVALGSDPDSVMAAVADLIEGRA